jgi:hypothetical protein
MYVNGLCADLERLIDAYAIDTDAYFRQNFEKMKYNPQSVYKINQFKDRLPQTARKLEIETQMADWISFQMEGAILEYPPFNMFGDEYDDAVEQISKMPDGPLPYGDTKRKYACWKLAERISAETKRIIDLPLNCTVLQLLRIIEDNYPRMGANLFGDDYSRYAFFDISQEGDVLKLDWGFM